MRTACCASRCGASVLVAGAAAGIAAAFNTPLAGVAFAIEELAAAYEQRMTLLVMTAVLIAGMISLGLAGDYLYFGLVGDTLSVRATLELAPVTGVMGGLAGAAFSRTLLWLIRDNGSRWLSGGRPIAFAAACGLIVALVGIATGDHLGHRLQRGARTDRGWRGLGLVRAGQARVYAGHSRRRPAGRHFLRRASPSGPGLAISSIWSSQQIPRVPWSCSAWWPTSPGWFARRSPR